MLQTWVIPSAPKILQRGWLQRFHGWWLDPPPSPPAPSPVPRPGRVKVGGKGASGKRATWSGPWVPPLLPPRTLPKKNMLVQKGVKGSYFERHNGPDKGVQHFMPMFCKIQKKKSAERFPSTEIPRRRTKNNEFEDRPSLDRV